jgi:hypothetical protein
MQAKESFSHYVQNVECKGANNTLPLQPTNALGFK